MIIDIRIFSGAVSHKCSCSSTTCVRPKSAPQMPIRGLATHTLPRRPFAPPLCEGSWYALVGVGVAASARVGGIYVVYTIVYNKWVRSPPSASGAHVAIYTHVCTNMLTHRPTTVFVAYTQAAIIHAYPHIFSSRSIGPTRTDLLSLGDVSNSRFSVYLTVIYRSKYQKPRAHDTSVVRTSFTRWPETMGGTLNRCR